MDFNNSKTTDSTGITPKNAVSNRRINIRMLQNVLLIWLDSNIDEHDGDCRNTLTQLRRVVHTIHTYTDGDQCLQFLQTMNNEKVCMIISDTLGQQMISQLHDMAQVDTIFVFCSNKKSHEQWVTEWPKIKGVFIDITPICEVLKKVAQQCDQDAMPISFMDTSGDMSKKNLDQLEPSFMYTQILKEILFTITFEPKHFQSLIEYCREALADNHGEPRMVKELERDYRDKTPIWWYTYPGFLYSMLNHALRLMDGDLIIRMGFFISDLHRHIHQLHQEQFAGDRSKNIFTVYRGQGLSATDFEQLFKTKGGLMSFNSFLSTSKNRNVSLIFAQTATAKPEMVDILFVMTIDPTKSTTPFASITGVSYFEEGEDEVLFSMHTVFRIEDITSMDENPRLFQVKLTLTSDDDNDLRLLTDRIREETDPTDQGWYRLGSVLLKMGNFAKAQEVYEILVEEIADEDEKGPIYDRLGTAHQNRGCYQEAIICFEKSLEARKRTLPPTHRDWATSYNNIGLVYSKMGDYAKALSYYEKALAIREQSLPPNHPDLGNSYNNIGAVYSRMADYAKALSYYEKALAIREQSLPPNHPDLGTSYNNIGLVYSRIGGYAKALSYYQKDLEINKQSLPSNHPALGTSYNNIGLVYSKMGDYAKALSYYQKDLEINKQSLPPNHPDLGTSYNNIGLVYSRMGDYARALSYYEQDLEINKQSLPPNHPAFGTSYNNIGRVYSKMGDYARARSYLENAVNIGQQSLPPNHPRLQGWRNNLDTVKKEIVIRV